MCTIVHSAPSLPAVNAKVACVFISLRNIISFFCCSSKNGKTSAYTKGDIYKFLCLQMSLKKMKSHKFSLSVSEGLSILSRSAVHKDFSPMGTALFVSGSCSEEIKYLEFLCFRNTQGLQSTTKLAVAVSLMSETNICNLSAPWGFSNVCRYLGLSHQGARGATASSGWRSRVQLHVLQSTGQPLTTELSVVLVARAAVTKYHRMQQEVMSHSSGD